MSRKYNLTRYIKLLVIIITHKYSIVKMLFMFDLTDRKLLIRTVKIFFNKTFFSKLLYLLCICLIF